MKITFDSALDGKAWPPLPRTGGGVIGKAQAGPLGLLKILETMLGLARPEVPDVIRWARLVPSVLAAGAAFWSLSAQVDPLGVAERLLRMRDFLWMHGWRQEPLMNHLADLAPLSKETVPGLPDRLAEVAQTMPHCTGVWPQIVLLEPLDEMAPAWQEVFSQIRARGGSVTAGKTPQAPAAGDLASARGKTFRPKKDHSIQLVRPNGMLQAAEDMAAWLAALEAERGLSGTVIVGGDVILDNALCRYGLPTTGSAASRYHHPLLQLLPLVLAMGWDPPDARRILELLTLPSSPVPPSVGRRLLEALGRWPALGGPAWKDALSAGLDAIGDAKRRQRVEQRLRTLFAPAVNAGSYPVSEIIRRVDLLVDWLRGRYQGDEAAAGAHSQCRIFLEMLDGLGLTGMSEPLLRKVLNQATHAAASGQGHIAQAGLGHAARPEAVIGPAERIVWWSFHRNAVPALEPGLFRTHERDTLARAGIVLPDPGRRAVARARRWRRPLEQATGQLILVCPETDEAGEELHPHPLWDELLAASSGEAQRLVVATPESAASPKRFMPKALAPPAPECRWQVAPGTIKPRDCESPSSLENLLGCPFKWALHYIGRIRGGNTAALPRLTTVLGSMAHEIMEGVLNRPVLPAPDDGAALAGRLFDRKGPFMVAELFQEGREGEKHSVRNAVVTAARSLLRHLHDAGAGALETEKRLSGRLDRQQLAGRADLVISKPFSVIDLKRRWAGRFRSKLESGTALQLVVYACLLKQETGVYPQVAYFILEGPLLITTDDVHFPYADVVAPPPLGDVWQALSAAYKQAWASLEKGEVLSPGNADAVESRLEDGSLTLEPLCRFCDYDVLCGQRMGEPT